MRIDVHQHIVEDLRITYQKIQTDQEKPFRIIARTVLYITV